MTNTPSAVEQAQALIRHPEPVAWNRAVADSMIGQTTQAVVNRLVWPANWLDQLAITPDPEDGRPPHGLLRDVDRAQSAIDASCAAQDLQTVSFACRAWWQAYQQIARAAVHGFFVVSPSASAVSYALPDPTDPLSSWNVLLSLSVQVTMPRPLQVRWLNADGTVRRDAWFPH